jgi:hypothetical protein
VGAVTSPLKLLAWVAAGARPSDRSSRRRSRCFPAGQRLPTDGEEQIAKLADLLATRPVIALNFTGQVGAADVRWLHEQKLRAELERDRASSAR